MLSIQERKELKGRNISRSKKGKSHPRGRWQLSEEGRQSISSYMSNRVVTKETRDKISASLKGVSTYFGEKRKEAGLKLWSRLRSEGYKRPEEEAERLRTINIGRKHTQKWIEEMKIRRRSEVIPKKNTKIEIKLQDAIRERNIPFLTHVPLVGQPDIFLPSLNVLLFADGCYWHGCYSTSCNCGRRNLLKGEYFIRGKSIFTKAERDVLITEKLRADGYIVFRFWEHEINLSPSSCIDKILELVQGKVYISP